MRIRRTRNLFSIVAIAACTLVLAGCGGGGDSSSTTSAGSGASAPAKESGKKITLWARDSSQDALKPLIDAWNADHANKVEGNFIPSAQYVPKLSAAAGGGQLPDIASSDIVYLPQLVKAGIYGDISEKVNALSYKDALIPAHMKMATEESKIYAVPSYVDDSALFINKDLFTKAGLDPNKPPATWDEILTSAKKIRELGGDTYGFWISGNCSGCQAFTFLPLVWANGGDVLSEDGTKATFDDPKVAQALTFFKDLVASGAVVPSSKNDDGKDFTNGFATGKVGMALIGGQQAATYKVKSPGFDWAVAPIPGTTSGRSTFVGGDAIGVTAASKNADAAWDFIQWTLEEPQQVGIYAKNGWLPLRTDLADNPESAGNPALVLTGQLLADGKTPKCLAYNEIFNDPTGPWLAMFRKAIYDGDVSGAIAEGQKQSQSMIDAAQ